MALFKCKMCGGALEINENITVAECEYCGSKQTVPSADNEKKISLFTRANKLRAACEFDKAAGVYESIVAEFIEEAEAYWGLILCNYGIEYVDDPKTGKKIPTCHRTSFDSVLDCENFELVMENADAVAKKVYREEAKAIEELRKSIIEVSSKEEPYDIFICYKETDEFGNRTIDSVIAQDVYTELTDKGYRVFFSRITLEDKLGQEYEPYIFAALNSAKVMLAFGTDYEYYNAVWVKNEWSRFLQLIEKGEKKTLIPCYKNIDAYDMPKEFAKLQAQNMGKVGAVQDLLRGIEKIIGKKESVVQVKERVVAGSGDRATVDSLLKRAFMFLEDGDWNSANEYCEKVLDIDPENASAYLGKLLSELRVRKQEALKEQAEPFDHSNNYQKVVRFANEKLKGALAGYIEHINTRNENARLDGIYTRAKNAMSAANTESAYKEAAQLFESISEYQDSAVLAQSCYEKAEVARKDAILSEGKAKMTGEAAANYEKAIKLFESISGWKDADEKIYACQKKIEKIKAKAEAERLEKERQAEIARKEAERISKRNKKIAIITTPIVCAIIAFIIVLNAVIIPNNKYNDAIALMDAGKHIEAISAFEALEGYKDSANKITACNTAILDGKYNDAIALMNSRKFKKAITIFKDLDCFKDSSNKIEECYINIYGEDVWNKFKSSNVGDTYKFGSYEQDNNTSNGKEEIEWLVLLKEETRMLLVSKYALDCKKYNTSYTDVTWETCTLRKWLNNDFINSTFTANEKAMIPIVTVSADENENPKCITNSGIATQDKVFLLSITEVNHYFNSDNERQCKPTDYAVANKVKVSSSNGNCRWYLRTPGRYQSLVANVAPSGGVLDLGGNVDCDDLAVRPALWIDLNS